jgi:dTDP-4-amino-4,6-dideoxy-D-galactose acyltransferase
MFFGYEVGKLELSEKEEFDFAKLKIESKGFRLIYIFSRKKLNNSPYLQLVDEKVTFYQKIDSKSLITNKELSFAISSFEINHHDIEQIRQLALQSGIYSRFHIDSNFRNDEYRRLYLEWIENCVYGNLAFDILVATDKSRIIGFTTLNKKDSNLADIGLVAVDSTNRGNGIGYNLISETIKRAYNTGFNLIQVVTQLNNIPAIKLYEKTNFKLKEIINIYHYWNL